MAHEWNTLSWILQNQVAEQIESQSNLAWNHPDVGFQPKPSWNNSKFEIFGLSCVGGYGIFPEA